MRDLDFSIYVLGAAHENPHSHEILKCEPSAGFMIVNDGPGNKRWPGEGIIEIEIERLRAENESLKKPTRGQTFLKVSEKGGLSVYGLGRFPVTLYREQWEKLLGLADEIDWSQVALDSCSVRAVFGGRKPDRIPPIAAKMARSGMLCATARGRRWRSRTPAQTSMIPNKPSC